MEEFACKISTGDVQEVELRQRHDCIASGSWVPESHTRLWHCTLAAMPLRTAALWPYIWICMLDHFHDLLCDALNVILG